MTRAPQFSLPRTELAIIVGVLAVLVASMSAPASARTFRDPYGGKGAAHVSDECGQGKYFVGVVGATGAWIDQIAVLCAELKSDGTYGGAKSIASRGGSGGGFHPAAICPKNQAVTSINIAVTENLEVAHILLVCTGGKLSPTQITWGGNGPYDRAVGQACLAGEVGKGLNINYGAYVNGVGIICDTKFVPPAPVASPQFCSDFAARMVAGGNEARSLKCPFLNEYRDLGLTRSEYVSFCLGYKTPEATTGEEERLLKFHLDQCKQQLANKPPPPPPGQQFIAVVKDVDVFTQPGGNDADRKRDANGDGVTLFTGTQGVTLVENRTPWFHVKWPGQDGWVYSGSGWVSLNLP